jgi:L-2-hydroxyglutarate oxidase LhgO
METRSFDSVVVGAGIVGLATALSLSKARPGSKVAVLEKENGLAPHQTSHNSGVIHSGIYYQPGTKRAKFCIKGKEMLVRFLDEHHIQYRRCGKLIVATTPREIPLLEELMRRGKNNGLKGLAMLNPEEAKQVEPYVRCLSALHVPETGIVDYKEVAAAYAGELTGSGGMVMTGTKLLSGARSGGEWHLETSSGKLTTNLLVNCGGLQNDRVARSLGVDPHGMVYPFRGEYHRLSPTVASKIRGLIYPAPDPELPFLGVHLTPTIHGDVLAGPNAFMAFAREGYLKRNVVVRDLWESISYSGFPPFIVHYAKTGFYEGIRSLDRSILLRDLQKFVPFVRSEDITWGFSGVRAELMEPHGEIQDDFSIRSSEGAFHVLNAPSPAATSSLALGEEIAAEALKSA